MLPRIMVNVLNGLFSEYLFTFRTRTLNFERILLPYGAKCVHVPSIVYFVVIYALSDYICCEHNPYNKFIERNLHPQYVESI